MKKILFLISLTFLAASCGNVATLYNWGGTTNGATRYEHLAYKSYDKQTNKSLCDLICVYEEMVSHPGGTRQVPPPGICAEYGYLLLRPGIREIFDENASNSQKKLLENVDFQKRGAEMLQLEMTIYPESAQFLQPLVKKIVK